MVKRPFLILGVASFFAALLCSMLSLYLVMWAVAISAVALIAGVCLRRYANMNYVLLAVTAVLLTALSYAWKEWSVVRPIMALDGQQGFAVMRVTETVADGKAVAVTLEQGTFPSGTKACLWLEAEEFPQVGELVIGQVQLHTMFDDGQSARAKNARAYGRYLNAWSVAGETLRVAEGKSTMPWEQAFFFGTRSWISDVFENFLSDEHTALCKSMLIGKTGTLSNDIETAFRYGGVYHLLVVSGLHLTLITGGMLRLLRMLRVPRRLRVVLTMAAVLWFAGLCGFSASILRAAVMMLLMLTAMLFRRRTDGLNTVGMAAFLMLLADPFCVLDVGWQLSFAATLGMVGLLPVWEREVTERVRSRFSRVGRWLAPLVSAVGVTLTAVLVTQPLNTWYFGRVSLVFLFTNLVAVPLASVLLILCVLLLSVAGWCAPLAVGLAWIIDTLCGLLCGYVSWWSSLPFSSVATDAPYVTVWQAALIGMVIAGYRLLAMRGVWRATAMMLAVLSVVTVMHTAWMQGVYTVMTAPSDMPWILVKTPQSVGLIVTAAEEDFDTLESTDIRRLDWVLYLAEQEPCGCSLPVSVEQLVLTESASSYTAYPAAEQVVTLRENDRLQIGTQASVSRLGNWYRLTLGETSFLLGGGQSDSTALPSAWCETEVLVLNRAVPKGIDRVQAQQVVFDSYKGAQRLKASLTHRFEAVWLPQTDESPMFFTRGNGDITLRTV